MRPPNIQLMKISREKFFSLEMAPEPKRKRPSPSDTACKSSDRTQPGCRSCVIVAIAYTNPEQMILVFVNIVETFTDNRQLVKRKVEELFDNFILSLLMSDYPRFDDGITLVQ
ncbi:hypothetical protein CSKR_203837 [Clonorchis sinensis]|uniref:Uncharacterized protein n=1 Tax=Clonorchis sinensis TaxID=79923 RepID=A0A8T1N3I5_CLOSI|nr:hypothetical protein CSKR_203837 [Clonorchis sinensis]